MFLEVTLIDVLPGRAGDFLSTYELARPMVADATGCRSVRLKQGADSVNRFLLLIEWDSRDAQEHNLRRTERFAQWRALIAGALAQPPLAEYFTEVDAPGGQPAHHFFAGRQ